VRAVCDLPALTELDLSRGDEVTDKSMRAISNNLPLLRVLELWQCNRITDKGVRALSILPALNHLNLDDCARVTKAGVQALRGSTASPSLSISSLNSCPWP
jgi:F-box/leucine-rich repeat protein 14